MKKVIDTMKKVSVILLTVVIVVAAVAAIPAILLIELPGYCYILGKVLSGETFIDSSIKVSKTINNYIINNKHCMKLIMKLY
jgi:hypothetical protein